MFHRSKAGRYRLLKLPRKVRYQYEVLGFNLTTELDSPAAQHQADRHLVLSPYLSVRPPPRVAIHDNPSPWSSRSHLPCSHIEASSSGGQFRISDQPPASLRPRPGMAVSKAAPNMWQLRRS